MHPLNRRLREVFFFSSGDLRANRSGQLSARQQARQQAAGASMGLGLLVFILVMFGTLGVIAFGSLSSGTSSSLTSPEMLTTLGIAGGVIGLVIVVGYFSSRKYMAPTRAKMFQKAEGTAQPGKIREDAAHFEVKIGRTKIRLITQEQFDAFQMGTDYRVFYLPGPTPTILSGEVIGTEAEADLMDEPETALEQDVVLRGHRAARPVVIVLAVLTLGIPLVGFAAASLPSSLRSLVMLVLLAGAIGFVFWALRRMSSA
jgi:hypothetical protein